MFRADTSDSGLWAGSSPLPISFRNPQQSTITINPQMVGPGRPWKVTTTRLAPLGPGRWTLDRGPWTPANVTVRPFCNGAL